MEFATNSQGMLQVSDTIGHKFTIENVSMNIPVLKFKQEISSKLNLPTNAFDLRFTNQLLSDRRKLFSYHIHSGFTITLLYRPGYLIKCVGEEKLFIPEAKPDWTVSEMKQSAGKKIAAIAQSITLMFDSKILKDAHTLRSYNIGPGDCITMQITSK